MIGYMAINEFNESPLCRLWDEILCRCQLAKTVVAQSFQEVSKIKGLRRRGCNHYCTRLV